MNEVDTSAKVIWDYMLLHQELRPMDAVFAMGSSDLRVAERAAQLFLAGYGAYLIVSGDSGVVYGKPKRLEQSEAEAYAEVAQSLGVPSEKIIIENKATNTGENIQLVRQLLEEKHLTLRTFLLVHKPYMERRAYATFRKQWPEADCVVTSPNISYDEYANSLKYKDRWIDIMVGDLQRIKEYPAKGFQISQDIPSDVWQAYERLVALGYTSYVSRA